MVNRKRCPNFRTQKFRIFTAGLTSADRALSLSLCLYTTYDRRFNISWSCSLSMCILQSLWLGLVVMGDDSCTRGRGFESQHWILDGHFLAFICCKNCILCLFEKRPKIRKRCWGWPIKNKHLVTKILNKLLPFFHGSFNNWQNVEIGMPIFRPLD